jgi:hypothetical protein
LSCANLSLRIDFYIRYKNQVNFIAAFDSPIL